MDRRKFIASAAALGAVASSANLALAGSDVTVDKIINKAIDKENGINAINHVGISTGDIEQSVRFYRDLFGMELLGNQIGTFAGERYEAIFQLKGARGKVATLSLGSMNIELFEFEYPRGKTGDPQRPVNHQGINHICFNVQDIQKEYQRLKEAGTDFNCPPLDWGFAKATYGRDPDGNVFELIEWVNA